MLKAIFRHRSILTAHKFKNTGLIPLSYVKTASVFLSSRHPNWEKCIVAINDFFDGINIHATIYVVLGNQKENEPAPNFKNTVYIGKDDVNWFGLVEDHIFEEKICDNVDLAISLSPNCFSADYCIASTRAKFRIGARQEAVNLYDLVISNPKGKQMSQAETFEAITGMLSKIK